MATELGSHLDALLGLPTSEGTRQIVFLASARGGFGTGAVVDLARIFTRLARDRQQSRGGFVPEVLVVLCDDQSDPGGANYVGFVHELSSVVLTGEFPRQVTFLPGDPLLDRTDSESPIHWVFRVAAADGAVLPVASAQLASLLVERRSRTRILEQATRLLSSPATSVPILDTTIRAIAIRPTLLADLVKSSLLLRLLGPDVLLDIVPKSSGGYAPREFSEDELLTLLSNWISDEPTGSPLAALLAALREPQETARWMACVQTSTFADDIWMRSAFLVSLNRQLAGRPARDGYGWTRSLMPSSAAAILVLLESRLTEVEARLPKTPEAARARSILAALRPVLTGASGSMGVWIQAFCTECETIGTRRTALRLAFRSAKTASLVRYLDPPDLLQADEEWSRHVLRRWLASSKSDELLQQRLSFCAESSQSGVAVFVRSLIEESVRLDTADAVIALFSRLAESLTSYIPERTVSQALERLAEDQQRELARGLVVRDRTGEATILAAAAPDSRFVEQIPRPADQSDLILVRCDDTSAMRRVQMSRMTIPVDARASFVDVSEQHADRARGVIERTIGLQVPLLPPRLRIALSRPKSFRAFAAAFWSGCIMHRPDASGAPQWYFADQGIYLTFGVHSSLAAAAANFAWHTRETPPVSITENPEADFEALDQWRKTGGLPSEEAVVQAAVFAVVKGSL